MKDNSMTMFLAGLGIGAAAALLLAPQTGAQLRGRIQKGAEDAGDYAKDQADALTERLRAAAADGKQKLGKQADKLADAAGDLRDEAMDAADRVTNRAIHATEKIRSKSKDMADQAIKVMENEGNRPQSV